MATVAIAKTLTTAKAVRQLSCWPSQVVSGLPTRMATDRPSSTFDTAAPRWAGGLIAAATSIATPKYAPCGRPATKRASNIVP